MTLASVTRIAIAGVAVFRTMAAITIRRDCLCPRTSSWLHSRHDLAGISATCQASDLPRLARRTMSGMRTRAVQCIAHDQAHVLHPTNIPAVDRASLATLPLATRRATTPRLVRRKQETTSKTTKSNSNAHPNPNKTNDATLPLRTYRRLRAAVQRLETGISAPAPLDQAVSDPPHLHFSRLTSHANLSLATPRMIPAATLLSVVRKALEGMDLSLTRATTLVLTCPRVWTVPIANLEVRVAHASSKTLPMTMMRVMMMTVVHHAPAAVPQGLTVEPTTIPWVRRRLRALIQADAQDARVVARPITTVLPSLQSATAAGGETRAKGETVVGGGARVNAGMMVGDKARANAGTMAGDEVRANTEMTIGDVAAIAADETATSDATTADETRASDATTANAQIVPSRRASREMRPSLLLDRRRRRRPRPRACMAEDMWMKVHGVKMLLKG